MAVMKSLGAQLRISNGNPPASRTASATSMASWSMCEKHDDSCEDEFTTAILGLWYSSGEIPIAPHCARCTTHLVLPTTRSLRMNSVFLQYFRMFTGLPGRGAL